MYPTAETCSSTAAGSRPVYEGCDPMVSADSHRCMYRSPHLFYNHLTLEMRAQHQLLLPLLQSTVQPHDVTAPSHKPPRRHWLLGRRQTLRSSLSCRERLSCLPLGLCPHMVTCGGDNSSIFIMCLLRNMTTFIYFYFIAFYLSCP